MPDGSEFQTAGAATPEPREANVVRTRGADNRLSTNSCGECLRRRRAKDDYRSAR